MVTETSIWFVIICIQRFKATYLLLCWFYIFWLRIQESHITWSSPKSYTNVCFVSEQKETYFTLFFNNYSCGNDENLYHPLEIHIHKPIITQITSSTHLWKLKYPLLWLCICPSVLGSYRKPRLQSFPWIVFRKLILDLRWWQCEHKESSQEEKSNTFLSSHLSFKQTAHWENAAQRNKVITSHVS